MKKNETLDYIKDMKKKEMIEDYNTLLDLVCCFVKLRKSIESENTAAIKQKIEETSEQIKDLKREIWVNINSFSVVSDESKSKIHEGGLSFVSNFKNEKISSNSYPHLYSFSCDRAVVSLGNDISEPIDFIDTESNIIHGGPYKTVKHFSCDRAIVNRYEKNYFEYIDPNGNVISKHEYQLAYNFIQHRARVKRQEGWFFLKPNGEELEGGPYLSCSDFIKHNDKIIAIVTTDLEKYLIDKDGNRIQNQ